MNWLLSLFQDRTFGAQRSSKWSEVRKEHLRVEPECQVCHSRLLLAVHHILPFHLHPELELDKNNLVTLCFRHHLELGHFFNWKKINSEIKDWIIKINI